MNIFKRRVKPEQPVVSVCGITESDWIKIYNMLVCEYNAAKDRQKSPDAKANSYMRGVAFGIKAMDLIKPYNIMKGESSNGKRNSLLPKTGKGSDGRA